ncbi:MAG: aldo/keto reductase [Chitinophagaceae bacterium]|nr:aldo/keto reductase [Chitinophagaceae bacterium]
MNNNQLYTTLNNGRSMPLLGLGVYDMHQAEAEKAIETALGIGYRLIDTAAMYNNEKEVGNAIRNSGVHRNEIFVTTKVNNTDHGYENALRAFDTSMKNLNIDYIDLYLVHWPIRGTREDTWKALEYLCYNQMVRAVGVANYLIPFLTELETYASLVPVLNQVEFSPFLYLKDLLNYCRQRNIQLQAYTPLTKGKKFKDPLIVELSNTYHKSPAQIILRWNIQKGVSAIPKSANPKRLQENFDIFDFEISEADMHKMDALNEYFIIVDDPITYL